MLRILHQLLQGGLLSQINVKDTAPTTAGGGLLSQMNVKDTALAILYESYSTTGMLKRQFHEIFDIFLFLESNSSGPLINSLKWFCLKIRFRRDIRENFTSVLACAESEILIFKNPNLATTVRRGTPRRLTLRGVNN